jgi:hypothetical protein
MNQTPFAASSRWLTSLTARKSARFALDYATWRARIAAPGSRFDSAPEAAPRIVRLETAPRSAASANDERRTA